MNKNELWQIFMKTGKVSDYLNYKKHPVIQGDCLKILKDNAEMNKLLGGEFVSLKFRVIICLWKTIVCLANGFNNLLKSNNFTIVA